MVFLPYFASTGLSAQIFGASEESNFYGPAGIGMAAFLLSPRSRWPAVAAAVVAAELVTHTIAGGVSGALGYALADVVEGLLGAALVLAWLGRTPDLRRTRDLGVYVAGACVVAPMVGSFVETGSDWALTGQPFHGELFQWWAGDGISILVLGSTILLWPKQADILTARPVETVVVLVAAAVTAAVGFGAHILPGTVILPVLAWSALRLSVIGTALTGSVIALVGSYVSGVQHRGLISAAGGSDTHKVALTQLFIAVAVVTAMITAQEVAKRTSAVRERDVERGERLRLESLSVLAQQMSAAPTPREVARVVEHQLLSDVGATWFKLGLLSHDRRWLIWVTPFGDPEDPAEALAMNEPCIAVAAVRTAKPVLVSSVDGYVHNGGVLAEGIWVSGAQSAAAWPLDSGRSVSGVLLLGWTEPQGFDAEQVAYLSTAGSMAGQALERAQAYADEHARAVVLHAALHPDGNPNIVGLRYSVCYEPSDVVHGLGGDWYDLMPLSENRTYLAVGDVVGHGLVAVEDMAQLRSASRAFAHRGQTPAQLLGDLNAFAGNVISGDFATSMVAVVDHDTGMLSYCSAGHPPAFLRRAKTGEVIRLSDANGPVLGPLDDVDYDEGIVAVSPGDILVMYTDGLVEAGGLAVSAGISRAESVVAAGPPEALLDSARIVEKLAPPPRSDDVCLVVVQFGQPARLAPRPSRITVAPSPDHAVSAAPIDVPS
ncbi:MAG: SpoIIE family protein phosphatase [Mycobacterium sp.]|nr:SpoIIE family protein phosphatase [Mycobacterium sp.]